MKGNSKEMITSRQVIKLSEDYLVTIHSMGRPTPIYTNPSSTDFKDLYKDPNNPTHAIRFFLDNTNKIVYVWDANAALHSLAAGVIKLTYKYSDPNLLAGWGILRNGKVYMQDSDSLRCATSRPNREERKYINSLLAINWSWASRYVDCSQYLNRVREVVNS